jgi:hypothetical protein
MALPPSPISYGPPTQAGRFVCGGPSSTGPFLFGYMEGITWSAQVFGRISSGGTGQNLGLS